MMRYMGSKRRLSKDILKILEPYFDNTKNYYEPFVGGANMIDKIPQNAFKNIVGSDFNKYLIDLLNYMKTDEIIEYEFIEKDDWVENYLRPFNKDNSNFVKKYEDWYIGYLGFTKTFNSFFMHQYSGMLNSGRNAQLESHNNIIKQRENIKHVEFIYSDYKDLDIEDNSVLYLDPPYINTTKYHVDIFHKDFFNWCRMLVKDKNCVVFVSEYYDLREFGFDIVFEKELKGKKQTEKVFKLCRSSKEIC